jgi:hypothetical protein
LGECALDEKEQEQNLQERLNAAIREAQRRCTLVADDRRLLHVLKRGLADKAIVTDALDVEETSVGRKADLAQFGKIFDGRPMRALEVARAQQAKSWELRAAMSMVRFWGDQGKRDAARCVLAPVYGWFTEGLDTLDLNRQPAPLTPISKGPLTIAGSFDTEPSVPTSTALAGTLRYISTIRSRVSSNTTSCWRSFEPKRPSTTLAIWQRATPACAFAGSYLERKWVRFNERRD